MLQIPYIVDLDDILTDDFHLDTWVEEHHELMDEIILAAATELIADEEATAIEILEFWLEGDVAAVLEMQKDGMEEALTNILEHWIVREEYEKAAITRDLILSLDK
jgi:hypothetical protein